MCTRFRLSLVKLIIQFFLKSCLIIPGIIVLQDGRQEESYPHKGSQATSFNLPDPSNGRSLSCDPPEMPKIQTYEEPLPDMPTLHSLFGSSLAFVSSHEAIILTKYTEVVNCFIDSNTIFPFPQPLTERYFR